MQCPVCQADSTDITPSKDCGVVAMRCEGCGEYEVAEEALHGLQRRGLESRKEALAKAKRFARLGTRPCISTTCFVSGESLV
jgi:hypothetical protein